MTMKTYPKGRVCATKGCRVVLSIYNDDEICAQCEDAVPLMTKPTHVGKYL